MMEHAGSYVTWDQLIQLGILLLAAGNLLYIIFHNHFDKKKLPPCASNIRAVFLTITYGEHPSAGMPLAIIL